MRELALVYGIAVVVICAAVIVFCFALLLDMQKHSTGYSMRIPPPPPRLKKPMKN